MTAYIELTDTQADKLKQMGLERYIACSEQDTPVGPEGVSCSLRVGAMKVDHDSGVAYDNLVNQIRSGEVRLFNSIFLVKEIRRDKEPVGPVAYSGYDLMTRNEAIHNLKKTLDCKHELRRELKAVKERSKQHLELASKMRRERNSMRVISGIITVAFAITLFVSAFQ